MSKWIQRDQRQALRFGWGLFAATSRYGGRHLQIQRLDDPVTGVPARFRSDVNARQHVLATAFITIEPRSKSYAALCRKAILEIILRP